MHAWHDVDKSKWAQLTWKPKHEHGAVLLREVQGGKCERLAGLHEYPAKVDGARLLQ